VFFIEKSGALEKSEWDHDLIEYFNAVRFIEGS